MLANIQCMTHKYTLTTPVFIQSSNIQETHHHHLRTALLKEELCTAKLMEIIQWQCYGHGLGAQLYGDLMITMIVISYLTFISNDKYSNYSNLPAFTVSSNRQLKHFYTHGSILTTLILYSFLFQAFI